MLPAFFNASASFYEIEINEAKLVNVNSLKENKLD